VTGTYDAIALIMASDMSTLNRCIPSQVPRILTFPSHSFPFS
jgi:hypothetical protein